MQQTVAINQTFLANMHGLWRTDPQLAQRIDDLPLDASLELEPARDGSLTAAATAPDGRRLLLHSRYDPRKEARDFVAGLELEDAACVLLCGLGLGYHVAALHERYGEELVVLVSEPDLVTIKTALEHTDLSRAVAAGRIEFLHELDKSLLHDRLNRHATLLMLGAGIAAPPAGRRVNGDFHEKMRAAVLDFAAFAKMSIVTLVKRSEITCRNIACNLPAYVSTPPTDLFRGRFRGCPAILVAAGPSLSKNISRLPALQNRAVIIAAQTTLRPLLDHGVRPHFVTSLDYSPVSRQFFEATDIPEETVLVAEPKAAWEAVDAFRGSSNIHARRVILLHNDFAHKCVGRDLARRSSIEAGATVMHLAFYWAQWLGCDPIIFIGQDLGFGGGVYYAPGVAMHRAWRPELGRFGTLEMKEWERIARHRPILRKVRDWEGREIYTDDQMFTYLEQFERDFARCPARVIDASEGGARKAGAEAMPLAAAAESYCRAPIDAGRFDYLKSNWYATAGLAPARAALQQRRAALAEFRELCEQTRALIDELTGLADDPPAFNRRLARMDELRTRVQRHDQIFDMVRDVAQFGELQKLAADRRIAVDKLQGPDRARRQLQRDRAAMDALLAGSATLDEILRQALDRFEEARGGS